MNLTKHIALLTNTPSLTSMPCVTMMDSGHYTTFCCLLTNNMTWYRFDNHKVYKLSTVKTSAACLLFCEAMNINICLGKV